ncbi:MAG: DUF2141 domain-containing protein [Tenuifilaceae bacterium]|nr:DUF2141 domain-containing protein [Tenuifilaceae bacterium]
MKEIFQILIFLCFSPIGVMAQHTLTIEIHGLNNNNGHVLLELSNAKEAVVAGRTRNISNNRCIIVIDSLKPGMYSFKFFHDENKNEKLDTNWLGIPKEGFGFSNNPSMNFGPPSFEKTIFELNESVLIKCKPKYF